MSGKAIVVHSFAHARAALAAATALDTPVVLLSAPGASLYAGPAWFREIVEQACAATAARRGVTALLDCGDRAGDVLAAYRCGVKGVIFTGREDVAARLAALAEAHDAILLRDRPSARDLLDEADAEAACRIWLSNATSPS